MNGRRFLGLLGTIALAVSGPSSWAQDFPTKPIKLIVPFPPGGPNDIIARVVGSKMSELLGQPVVIDNRGGAGGVIGTDAVAKAEPDGYTILAHSNGHTMAPAFFKQLPYDTVADFAGITPLGSLPHVLVIAAEQKIKTIKDLVAAGKSRPGGITFGAVMGTAPHLNAVHFVQSMGIEGRAVPFKGAPEALTEVLAGRVDIYFSPITPALPFLQDGKMHAIAVTSHKRAGALPDVPTTFEQDYKDSEFGLWIGSYAPAKTPRDIVNKLHDETVKALANTNVIAKLKQMGVEPMPMAPEAMDAFIKKEVATNAELARKAGVAQQ